MNTHDLGVTLDAHTVDTPGGVMAGFLVRDAGSRRSCGYIWTAGGGWRWRTASGAHFGERSSKRAAIETVRDNARAEAGEPLDTRQPRLPLGGPTDAAIRSAWRAPTSTPARPIARPTPAPAPSAPARQVVWPDESAPDIAGALGRAFTQHKGAK